MAAPLTALTKKNARWSWGDPEDCAFRRLKEALTTTPVCPDFAVPFQLQTDASSHGLGAVLTEHQAKGERIIAYVSRTLNAAERNYNATELKCLAVVWGIRRMRDYLEGYRFTVVTELQQFDINIRYRRGGQNQMADALSREAQLNAIKRSVTCPWYPPPSQRGEVPTNRSPGL